MQWQYESLYQPGRMSAALWTSGNTWYWPVCLLLFCDEPWTAPLTHSAISSPVSGLPVILKLKGKKKKKSRLAGKQGGKKSNLSWAWRNLVSDCCSQFPVAAVPGGSLCRPAAGAPDPGQGSALVLYPDAPLQRTGEEGFNWSLDVPPEYERNLHFTFKQRHNMKDHKDEWAYKICSSQRWTKRGSIHWVRDRAEGNQIHANHRMSLQVNFNRKASLWETTILIHCLSTPKSLCLNVL